MLNYIYGSIVGIIQGLTEFLPISSSGHLFVAQHLSNKFLTELHFTPFITQNMPLLYVVLLHVATLCAVLIFTRTIVIKSMRACLNFCINVALRKKNAAEDSAYVHLFFMVCVATFATLPLGLFLKNTVVNASLGVVIMGFFITAALLCIPLMLRGRNTPTVQRLQKSPKIIRVSITQAVCIGLIQGCAVLPGISRSGSTIVVGVLLGLSFAHAAYFSFILAIPTILISFLSSALETSTTTTQSLPISFTLISMASAFLAGLLGLSCILALAQRKKLWVFSLYLVSLSTMLLLLNNL